MTRYILTYIKTDKKDLDATADNFEIDTKTDNLEETISKLSKMLEDPNVMIVSIKKGNYSLYDERMFGVKKIKNLTKYLLKYIDNS